MDTYSSGEDLLIKTRKPYTITKQRERWTEEEHSRFLDALKLYGRAWQRIEEHIGTKTAVQIRSHAQKFFSKLEKEALVKGASLGQALDIDIPPPRPKRKPSNPYPRKSSAPSSLPVWAKDGKPLTSNSSLYSGEETLDLENTPPPEQPAGSKYPKRVTESLDEHNCSEVLNLFLEAPCASITSASKSSITEPAAVPANPCTLKEFVPSTKERTIRTTMEKSYPTVEPKECQKMDTTDANNTDLDSVINETQNSENHFQNSFGIQGNQNYPRHVPVHIVDGSSETYMKIAHENPNLFKNPIQPSTTEDNSNMSSSSIHHPLPSFIPPFSPLSNIQENYQSYLNLSSTFSSLIVSNLLQNPAAHAAACLAASFSTSANTEFSVDSPAFIPGGFPPGHNPSPSMPTIAAVTVAAASAWWAAHGMFPLCTPFHPGLACTHAPVALNPLANAGQAPVVNKESKNNSQDVTCEDQKKDPEFSETPKTQHSASKSPPQSSSDSEESEGTRLNGIELNSVDKPVVATGLHESNKPKTRKQVDRSSCGSNTSSSSEIETTNLENNGKGNEESKEPDVNQSDGDINNRRIRSAGNINEFWKEVSEEGKLAFQALFSREVLPQSFSPPHDLRNMENGTEECLKLQLDLNSKIWEICPNNPEEHKDELLRRDNNSDKGLLEVGHGKLKTRRTGFKPYKRCSVEAKESNRISNGSGQGEEKGPKRIRLEGETSMC